MSMPRVFDEPGDFFTFLQDCPRPRVCVQSGDLRFTTALVYDKASDRALVQACHHHSTHAPFVGATLECDMGVPGDEPPPVPFYTLAEAGSLDWHRPIGSVGRQGILRIGDEKEVSPMYRSLGDDAPRYAWIHRSVLDAVLRERLASHGLSLCVSLFL